MSSSLNLVIVFFFLLCVNASCGQKPVKVLSRNNSLPKEINLNPNTGEIIDSVFIFKNGIKKLETVQVFELKNGILTSGNRKYFVNDTLNQTTNESFDSNGNSIESKTILHFKNSTIIYKRELDEFGNLKKLKTTEGSKVNILEYQNKYEKEKLVSVDVMSAKSNNIIKKTIFKYDFNGNLIEEKMNNSFLDVVNLYQFNEANQLVLHKHIRNGTLKDSVIYYYDEGLLKKKEWFENTGSNPMIKKYEYNKNKQVVLETEELFGGKAEYKEYDAFGNWHIKEQYAYGNMNRLTKRLFKDL
jgi:hypothetical protein